MKQLVSLAMAWALMLSLSFGQGESASVRKYREANYQDTVQIMAAAKTGNVEAQHILAKMYDSGGLGVPQNKVEALKWYRAAADQGYPDAQDKLGSIYYKYSFDLPAEHNTYGVLKNNAEAERWRRKAFTGFLERAMQGDATAQQRIGEMYHYGTGVPKDPIKGYAWLNLAAALGKGALGEDRLGDLKLESVLRSKRNAAKELTVEQIMQAQELSLDLFKRIYTKQ